ncbi:hypothetical protein CY34DRAFT_569726 [Suillus luteus UH-Slu-Lm8-n1]|uniref:Uncharacterized protein n=1 Tax=Suillus luteus UH-Slu-Lm8-n1 TaxID=930992 RepID=A0A0D0A1B1_9AGAM|nr:hypothetical protein CY34DRAFT_569726 [Suillus luteus UH-Slu-Lm8-n1]
MARVKIFFIRGNVQLAFRANLISLLTRFHRSIKPQRHHLVFILRATSHQRYQSRSIPTILIHRHTYFLDDKIIGSIRNLKARQTDIHHQLRYSQVIPHLQFSTQHSAALVSAGVPVSISSRPISSYRHTMSAD